jgi:hypothetical protein
VRKWKGIAKGFLSLFKLFWKYSPEFNWDWDGIGSANFAKVQRRESSSCFRKRAIAFEKAAAGYAAAAATFAKAAVASPKVTTACEKV